MNCIECGHEHDGTLMRTDPRFSRIRTMLNDPAVPRDGRGLVKLCHVCQREMCFRGGYIAYLARTTYRLARYEKNSRARIAREFQRATRAS